MAEQYNYPVGPTQSGEPLSGGFGNQLAELFKDPNFINLLAGIGKGLDPQGVGGALGTATQAYVGAQAAQNVGAKTLAPNAYEAHISRLGGHSLPGKDGVTATKVNPDGSITTTTNVSSPETTSQGVLSTMSTAPVAPVTPLPPVDVNSPEAVQDLVSTGSVGGRRITSPQNPTPVTQNVTASSNNGAQPSKPVSNPEDFRAPDLATRRKAVETTIDAYAPTFGVSPQVIKGLASVENGQYKPGLNNAQFGAAGGQGLLQIIPSTWKDITKGAPHLDPSDPDANLAVGMARYARALQYYGGASVPGAEARAIAAYHSGEGNIPREGPIPEIVEQTAPGGRVFKQYPAQYVRKVLSASNAPGTPSVPSVPSTLPEYPQVVPRTTMAQGEFTAEQNIAGVRPEDIARAGQVASKAQGPQVLVQSQVNDLVERRTFAPSSISARDLRGLSPEQVDSVVGKALQSQRLAVEVAELTGRDAREVRKELQTQQTTVETLKLHAAKTIAASNLAPDAQASLLDRVGTVTTLQDARDIAIGAERLPKLISSGEERDSLARAMFTGKVYGQLQPAQQEAVNTRLLADKATWQIVANEQGLFRINNKNGNVDQVTEQGPVPLGPRTVPPVLPAQATVSPSVSEGLVPGPTSSGSSGPGAPGAIVPYSGLSPLAREISSPSTARPFGAKAPTGEQEKAFTFGSRALQAHELVHNLEARGEYGNSFGLGFREAIRNMSTTDIAAIVGTGGVAGAVVGGLPGAVIGGAGGVALGFGARASAPLLNLLDTPEQRQYLQAKLDFMTSVLRKESGAAISVGEFSNEDKRYFPQYNDSPETIRQKELAREGVLRAFQQEAGRKLSIPLIANTPVPSAVTPVPGMIPPGTGAGTVVPSSTSTSGKATIEPPRLGDRMKLLVQLQSVGLDDIQANKADDILLALGTSPGSLSDQDLKPFSLVRRAALRSRMRELNKFKGQQ